MNIKLCNILFFVSLFIISNYSKASIKWDVTFNENNYLFKAELTSNNTDWNKFKKIIKNKLFDFKFLTKDYETKVKIRNQKKNKKSYFIKLKNKVGIISLYSDYGCFENNSLLTFKRFCSHDKRTISGLNQNRTYQSSLVCNKSESQFQCKIVIKSFITNLKISFYTFWEKKDIAFRSYNTHIKSLINLDFDLVQDSSKRQFYLNRTINHKSNFESSKLNSFHFTSN